MFIVVVSSCEKEKTGLLDICEWSFSFEPVEYDCFDLVSPYSLHNPYEKLVGKIILDNSTNETLYYYTYKQPGGVGTLHINRKWSNIDMCSPESLNEDLLAHLLLLYPLAFDSNPSTKDLEHFCFLPIILQYQ